jgi:Protein of unknown function (DUF3102)
VSTEIVTKSSTGAEPTKSKKARTQTEVESTMIADTINREHDMAITAAASAMEHAARCGELLIKQKKGLKHGEWQAWVAANLAFSVDTAQNYMEAARCPKTERDRFLSLRQMINYNRDIRRAKRYVGFQHDDLERQKKMGVPEGHDLEAWSAFSAAADLVYWFANEVKGLDPLALYRGSVPTHMARLRPHLKTVTRFVVALSQLDRDGDFFRVLDTAEKVESAVDHSMEQSLGRFNPYRQQPEGEAQRAD